MPDWQSILRQRLGPLRLSPQGESDVLDELGAHFEQLYEEATAEGASPQLALAQATAQVPNWKRFRRDLRRSKEDPMPRLRQTLLVPALASALAVHALSWGVYLSGWKPPLHARWPYGATEWLVWMAAAPFCGALGAWMSRRAGGSLRDRVLSGMAPLLIPAALLVLSFLLDMFDHPRFTLAQSAYVLAGYTLDWVLLPAAALLVGALPVSLTRPPAGSATAGNKQPASGEKDRGTPGSYRLAISPDPLAGVADA
ncbi:MAG TPA: hypothetical protein VE825_10175 [Terriglobales bacterium]|jgi:hypothetical protein|nr:hypothetical protein [Terriglobales bacterium]